MEIDTYQELAARTIGKDMAVDEQVMHSLHGMVGELGEIHSLYQKVYQGHKLDLAHLKSECGDLLWFIAEFATAHGWTLSEITEHNIEKLEARYPEGFEVERSLNRAEGDI